MDFDIFDIEDATAGGEAAPTIIKVVGVGGGGGNAVNRMIASGLKKVSFVALNTDVQALQRSNAQTRIAIGKELTGGLGAGGVPEVGEKAAIESKEEIKAELENSDMVFITAGMGGGTGTGAAAVVAEISKSLGALTVAVVTTPFAFEGKKKLLLAQQGIERLRKQVDTLILIPNQHLLKVVEANTPIKQAFLIADSALLQAVQGISDLITEPGEINIDFADVKTIMKGKGDALIGLGFGEGANRAEYQDVVEVITESCAEDALIIAGQSYNQALGDRIKVTVIATGFEHREVSTSFDPDTDVFRKKLEESERRRDEAEAPAQEAPQHKEAPSQVQRQGSDPATITVNRWQDLQQQLGKRNASQSDYSIPAVLRYSRNDDENS